MSELEVRLETRGGETAVVVSGELDLSTVEEVEEAIRKAEHEGPVILDLAAVRFLDSTGLRLVLAADARARDKGERLRIVPGPERVQRVFRVARLEDRLEFVEGAP